MDHRTRVRCLAGAPISWGVCEVPGWGRQLDPTRVFGEMSAVGLDATELGLERCDPGELRGGSPDDNARIIRDVFAGARGAQRDAILLNAAGAIAAAGHAADLRDGLALATEAVDSGAAGARLDDLAGFTHAAP